MAKRSHHEKAKSIILSLKTIKLAVKIVEKTEEILMNSSYVTNNFGDHAIDDKDFQELAALLHEWYK